MGKLSEILNAGGYGGDDFTSNWASTAAAGDFDPLPAGWYICRIESGELDASNRGTPGYKLTFVVLEGEHEGRKLWQDLWLTPAALPMAKRDLRKLGIVEPSQLEQPLPSGFRCRVQVALRRDDDGTERNRVRRFDVIGIDTPEPDAFAPEPEEAPAAPEAPQQQDLDLKGGADVPFE
ncbi:hypothetical protein KOR34_19600 [Posidoniimonas corsicana]|uniref:DUF669 domain-containing protein n=1 Tax=Posidoniimonas corsicana TaxID=1938618 RepID=A0A5C5VEF3_9BACT|nr:DUF669 domain-containing protein [Posidoniimonas corsicana]TWT37014.1 hypothetical protein KOR34_19600 [Posidoniimonas corsicana]